MMQQLSGRLGGAATVYCTAIYCAIGCWIVTAVAHGADDWQRMKSIAPRGYVCGATATPLTIDGRFDEAAWAAAPWTADFADIEGDRKPRPRFRTRAKMLWDQQYFYIAAELDEPHVWARLAEHDAVIFYDNDFEVFIDPDGDNHEYYELELNALNTTWDLLLPKPYKDGGAADHRWEFPGLKTAVHVRGTLNDPGDQDAGWNVEIAIPWQALARHAHRSAPPSHGDQWRVDFSRVEWRHEVVDGAYRKVPDTREDNWVWSPPGIVDMHRPERWGYVQFSTAPQGATVYVPDPTSSGRDVLMEVYHRQKTFFDEHGRWARRLKELAWQLPTNKQLPEPLEMWLTDDGFQASLSIPVSGDTSERWHVRQDSRLWTDVDKSMAAIAALIKHLASSPEERGPIAAQDFAKARLTKRDAFQAAQLLWQDHVAELRLTRAAEMKARELVQGKLKMPFTYETFGAKPASGRSLVISMHGGGGATKRVNDQQWENQKRLYKLQEGVYVAPRAPTDTWDLWHQSHIDGFFERLIENFFVFEEVDPNRVYLMGYSAGGDGVYQLAPRMADRWAAAAMMAGHPNETSPLGLRNLPFTIHVGAKDAAYDRNKIAGQWQQKLADLHHQDPQGYVHSVTIHADKVHWMDRQDAVAIGWMAQHQRDPWPQRIVWKQDDVARGRFYWLAAEAKDCRDRAEVVAQRDAQHIDLQTKDVDRLTVRLCDEMLDLDQVVEITCGGKTLFQQNVTRTIGMLAKTLAERGEPQAMFSAEVTVALPTPPPAGTPPNK